MSYFIFVLLEFCVVCLLIVFFIIDFNTGLYYTLHILFASMHYYYLCVLFTIYHNICWSLTGLWGLINNVGISGEIGPFEWVDKSVIERLFQVNVLGTVGVVQAFLPLIKKSGSGRIVNTTSILGRVSVPYAGPYCMTKFALEAFSNSLRYSKFLLFIPYNVQ